MQCVATKNQGIEELVAELDAHREWLTKTEAGQARRLRRLREAMRNQLRNTLIDHAEREMHDAIELAVTEVATKVTDPYTAAESLVTAFKTRS